MQSLLGPVVMMIGSLILRLLRKNETKKLHVCIDLRELNRSTPKDEYPIHIADFLVNAASGHRILIFLGGNAGYNQIFMADEDISKMAFICPGFVGFFEWVVMTFGLLSIIVEVYIDDIIAKSARDDSPLADLIHAFEKMCLYKLKMNPLKCAFGVSIGKFLGFIVHEKGIEIDPKKIEAIRSVKAQTCKKDLKTFLGMVNYLRRLICNLSGKVNAFTPLLRLKNDVDFTWGQSNKRHLMRLRAI
jgi:hypothetical protein